jgi:hypothetical protein
MPATTIPFSNTLWGWNNYVLPSPLAASSEALPVYNLKDERGAPSVGWQTASGVTQNAIMWVFPTINRSIWRVWGAFRSNLTPFARMTVTLWNQPDLVVWVGSTSGPEPGFGQSILVAPDDKAADYCSITFDDPGNPQQFINIPLIYAGPAWMMASPPAYDTMFGGDAAINEAVSRGGQEFPVFLYERRRAELAFAGIRQGEVLGQLAELQQTARRGNNILFIPDVMSGTISMEAIYGRVTATADVGFPYAAADRRSWRARVTERL